MEAGVAVPELVLLPLRETLEAVVALAGGAETVLAGAVEDAKDGEEEDGNLADKVDGVAVVVLGRVGLDVGPAARDVSTCSGGAEGGREGRRTLRRYHRRFPD